MVKMMKFVKQKGWVETWSSDRSQEGAYGVRWLRRWGEIGGLLSQWHRWRSRPK